MLKRLCAAASRHTTCQHHRLFHPHVLSARPNLDNILINHAFGHMAAGVLNSALSMSPPDTMTEEDKCNERKRDILVLVMRFLADYGFLVTYQSLCAEASMTLDQVGQISCCFKGCCCTDVGVLAAGTAIPTAWHSSRTQHVCCVFYLVIALTWRATVHTQQLAANHGTLFLQAGSSTADCFALLEAMLLCMLCCMAGGCC